MSDASLAGVLDASSVRATVETIAACQLRDGMICWFEGGHADPWNHVEAAMALAVGGERDAAELAYDWLVQSQRADGSWHTYYLPSGEIEEPRLDTNVCAYVATGVWHHFLVTRDRGFLEDLWPTVRSAVEFVLGHQRPGGELCWSIDPDGTPGRYGLVAGSSSAYLSLRCAIATAEVLGEERPDWELAAGRLRHAVANRSEGFAAKHEFAMDWYYPVLTGVLGGQAASERINERWAEFVMDQHGVRCVSDRPWVTTAETAECAIALCSLDRRAEAAMLLGWAGEQRCLDGSYTTGVVLPERVTYPPGERSTYTAAAVVLASDVLVGHSATSELFGGRGLPSGLDLDSEALGEPA